MHRKTLRLSVIGLISASLLLGGCSSTPKNVIPSDGPHSLEVYESHVASGPPRMYRPVHADKRDLSAYTREAESELRQLFPRLPNPEMVLYVFPHQTAKGRPVPGYSTAFRLYERDEYALPGEIRP